METEEKSKTKEVSSNFQIVVFKLGSEEYGISIDQIKEVVITPNITHLPQTPAYVKGVANIRGNIIAILDLEEKFGLAKNIDTTTHGNNFTLVVESEEFKMGVLVKEVPNTLSISRASMEETIFTGGDSQSDQSHIKGIVKLDKRLIIMIDILKVISEQDAKQLFKKQAAVA